MVISRKIAERSRSFIALSIGSNAWVMISTKRKKSTPIAKALRKTIWLLFGIRSLAIGIPKKIVSPDIPPKITVCRNDIKDDSKLILSFFTRTCNSQFTDHTNICYNTTIVLCNLKNLRLFRSFMNYQKFLSFGLSRKIKNLFPHLNQDNFIILKTQ